MEYHKMSKYSLISAKWSKDTMLFPIYKYNSSFTAKRYFTDITLSCNML